MNQYHWDLEDPVMSIIAHHGIKGQKWGVRRFQDKNGRLTAEGKKHKFEDKSQSNMSNRDIAVNNLKTAATIGVGGIAASIAAVAASPITAGISTAFLPAGIVNAAYGTINSISAGATLIYGDINDSIANNKEKKFQEEREKNSIDKKTGFHKKTTEMTAAEDMERVNPAFKNWDKNTKNNCVLCSMAFELRRRGYDVQANKATSGYNQEELAKDWFTGAKSKTSKSGLEDHEFQHGNFTLDKTRQKEMIDDTLSTLKSQKDGARGTLGIVWNGTTSGHSISYAVENGEVSIYDTQSNEKFIGDKAAEKYLKKTSRINVIRLDNCKLNTKYIKEVAA